MPPLITTLLAALLSACAGLPSAQRTALPDDAVPAAWQHSPAQWTGQHATSLAGWWQRFDDSALTALVTQAMQANPSVQGARSALQRARAQADVQRAGLGPTVTASAAAQRSQAGRNDASNVFQAGFDASWEPDVFGGKRSAVDASDADAQTSAASLADVQVSLAAEVAINYIELRNLQARLTIARSNLATQHETLQLTRWRAQAGLVSSLDVELAVTAAQTTQAQLPVLQTGLALAQNALAVLTGQPPGAPMAALRALGTPAPLPAAPTDLALAFPAETLRQRADVRAAELAAVAALARVGVAEAALRPSFRLSGSLGLSALTLGTLGNSASLLGSLLAGVSAPLFDGGAGQAQVRVQEAALEQARAAYRVAVLAALQDVEDALVSLRGDQERVAGLQAASNAAANAELLARSQYGSGLIDFSTVLSTQRSLLSAQDSLASAQGAVVADHVRLYKALGGGWQADPEVLADATADGSPLSAPLAEPRR